MPMFPNRQFRGHCAWRKSVVGLFAVLCSFAWPTFAFHCPGDVNPQFEMSYYDNNSGHCVTVRDLKGSSGIKNWIVSAKDVCSASFPNSTIHSWTEFQLDSMSSHLNDIQSRLGQTVLNGIYISAVRIERSSKVMNLETFDYNNHMSTTYRCELIEVAEEQWFVNCSLPLLPEHLMAIFTGKMKPPICLVGRLHKGETNRIPRTTAIECNDINDQVDIAFCEHADLDAYCSKWGKTGECAACSSGLSGRYCETDINECSVNSLCGAHGICINAWGTYMCNCMKGYTGKFCDAEIDECLLKMPCGDNGVCQKLDKDFICICKQGYTGRLCELDVNECLVSDVCHNNGYCTNTNGSYYCLCNEGYTGQTCESDVDECVNKSLCNDRGECRNTNGSFYCECRNGYTGNLCEKNITECVLRNSCGIHGKCLSNNGSFTCACDLGYTGQLCTEDIDECLTGSPCGLRGSCENMVGSFKCHCLQGSTGPLCKQGKCLFKHYLSKREHYPLSDVDECAQRVCKNGGTCVNVRFSFWCVCPKGFTGSLCQQDIDECKHNETICGLHGECTNLVGSYKCECFDGYTGVYCETAPISAGASKEGDYAPMHLLHFDAAVMSMCDVEACGPLGKCFVRNNNFTCLCAAGVTGRLCNKAASDCWVDNPCGRNGFCRQVGNSFTCKCSYGHTGRLCDRLIDFCKNTSICNGGKCISDLQGGYYCVCPVGFTGSNCEIAYKPCESQHCSINGVCEILNETDRVDANNHRCICNAGWTGPRCTEKVDMCKGNDICGINGRCVENAGKLYCLCKAGYSGDHCEEKIKRCLILNPCGNGGVCRTYDHNFRCECFAGFTGLHSERPVGKFPMDPKDDSVRYLDDRKGKGQQRSGKDIAFNYTIIGIVVAISLCLMLLLMGRAARISRAAEKKQNPLSP
ncbi:EGF-like domain protein [Trichuris suis]|nr:EGF-like domain protein [Trichuris suis]